MARILILFAHPLEAQATLEHLGTQPTSLPNHYLFEHGTIVICGMGIVAATAAAARAIENHDDVWNFGVVGSLREDIEEGSVGEVHTVLRPLPRSPNPELSKTLDPPLFLPSGRWRLATSDVPIYHANQRLELQKVADVVDMEGYGIARAAQAANKPCRIWKAVSDQADEKARYNIRQRLPALSELLAKTVVTQLDACVSCNKSGIDQ